MKTVLKNYESQKIYKTYAYDLYFRTEDIAQEVKLKASKGSYQQFIRTFNFNLEEIFTFV